MIGQLDDFTKFNLSYTAAALLNGLRALKIFAHRSGAYLKYQIV